MRTQVYLLLIGREKYSLSVQFLPLAAITSQKTLQGCHTSSHTSPGDYSLRPKETNLRKNTIFMLKDSTQQHSSLFTMMIKAARTLDRLSILMQQQEGTSPSSPHFNSGCQHISCFPKREFNLTYPENTLKRNRSES